MYTSRILLDIIILFYDFQVQTVLQGNSHCSRNDFEILKNVLPTNEMCIFITVVIKHV